MVFWDLNTFRGGVFRGKLVIFLARSYFFCIFGTFKDLFKLDMLL